MAPVYQRARRRITYSLTDIIIAFFLGVIVGTLIIAAVIEDVKGAQSSRDDSVDIAHCISEYAYTHPSGNRFNNLVRAIRWCNVGDKAVAHECITPCTVVLPKGTLEDEFGIDFGWRNKQVSIVDVYVPRR